MATLVALTNDSIRLAAVSLAVALTCALAPIAARAQTPPATVSRPTSDAPSLFKQPAAARVASIALAQVPEGFKSEQAKCRRTAERFHTITDRAWSDGSAMRQIRSDIEKLTTRDYDVHERRSATSASIFLEGSSSSRHWHDVHVVADLKSAGAPTVRIVAVWSLAYGQAYPQLERALSLIEYVRDGTRWQIAAAGIGLATYVVRTARSPHVLWLDRENHAVALDLPSQADRPLADAASKVVYLPYWGCVLSLEVTDPSSIAARISTRLKEFETGGGR